MSDPIFNLTPQTPVKVLPTDPDTIILQLNGNNNRRDQYAVGNNGTPLDASSVSSPGLPTTSPTPSFPQGNQPIPQVNYSPEQPTAPPMSNQGYPPQPQGPPPGYPPQPGQPGYKPYPQGTPPGYPPQPVQSGQPGQYSPQQLGQPQPVQPGVYPPPGQPSPYPQQSGQPGAYPTPGQYPPPGQPLQPQQQVYGQPAQGTFPTSQQPVRPSPYPPQQPGQPGAFPPPGQPGQYPPPGQPGAYPPPGQPGQYPPPGQPVGVTKSPYPGQPQTYPGQPSPYPQQGYPAQSAYPPGQQPSPYPPQQGYPPQSTYPSGQQSSPYPAQSIYPPGQPVAYPQPQLAPPKGYPGAVYAAGQNAGYAGYQTASYGYGGGYGATAYVATPAVRTTYAYSAVYSPYQPFVVPIGLPPHLATKMLQASVAFRMFDRDCSGYLSKHEWKKALKHLGYYFHKGTAKALFYAVDTDHSGRISEREFCEWWIHTNPY